VRADRTICVVGSAEQATTLAGPLRLLQSDLVLVPEQDPTAAGAVARWTSGEVVRFSLRPTPASPLPPDAVTAFFTTGSGELEGAEPVFTSQNLARRDLLEEDLRDAAALGCTHYLTELKAAAIDTVAMRAEAAGADVVFVRNRPVGEAGVDLDVILLDLYDRAAMHSAAVGAQASDGS
jgi:predicted GTPase